MNKLKLNKKTIAQMDRSEMNSIKGGIDICLISCKNVGTRKSKKCCNRCTFEEDGDKLF